MHAILTKETRLEEWFFLSLRRLTKQVSPRSFGIAFLCLFAVKAGANPLGEPFPQERDALWQKAVSIRSAEELSAPSILKYVQYELDSSGAEKSREQGVWAFSYDLNGKATIRVVEAVKDGKDFTEERKRRLSRGRSNASRMLDILSPFDSSAQPVLKLGDPLEKSVKGKVVREFPFQLPQEERKMVGFAWVDPISGNPIGFQYTISPLPWFVDKMEIQVWFDAENRPGLFREVSYSFAASFLVFSWIGGGIAWPSDWIRLTMKPRFGN